MKMPVIVYYCILCALLFVSASCRAAIIVVPDAPTSAQDTHIQVVNQYGPATSILGYTVSDASIVSATITRSGGQFLIVMTVDVVCPGSPSNRTLTVDFDVGALNAGTYQVTAQITHRSHFPACGGPFVIQTATFGVANAEPVAVPTVTGLGYLIAVWLLTLFAAEKLWSQASDRGQSARSKYD